VKEKTGSLRYKAGVRMSGQILLTLTNAMQAAWRFILTIKLADIVDIAIISFVIYKLLGLIRATRAGQLAKGLLLFFIVLWASSFLELNVVNFILNRAVELGLLSLVIIFQPELRRALEQVGSSRLRNFLKHPNEPKETEHAITHTVTALTQLSKERKGALIVFERKSILDDIIKTGVFLDAAVSAELLENIFYPKTPMHDGAVIIRNGRVVGAGCMLPMSGNNNLSRELGMRHRAGIGMSEHSDAVVAIVSEETGSISVAMDGMLKRHLAPETVEKLLRNELLPVKQEIRSKVSLGTIGRFFLELIHAKKRSGNNVSK
jgi:diadenylate cyclase